jgi:hypothetical protein
MKIQKISHYPLFKGRIVEEPVKGEKEKFEPTFKVRNEPKTDTFTKAQE